MIVADENLHGKIIKALVDSGREVFPIGKFLAGISDKEVIQKAKELSAVIITEDKDFGELVFSYNITYVSIIFLRYTKSELDVIIQNLSSVLSLHDFSLPPSKFVTITPRKVRIRTLHF